jgi:hypothetical protein
MAKDKDPIIFLPMIGKLRDHGIAIVRASFDGQGDSGEVYETEFYDIDDEPIDYKPDRQLEDYIYSLIEDCVNSYGGDWVNNDGGYGSLTINVKDKSIEADYNQRTVDEYSWSALIFDD